MKMLYVCGHTTKCPCNRIHLGEHILANIIDAQVPSNKYSFNFYSSAIMKLRQKLSELGKTVPVGISDVANFYYFEMDQTNNNEQSRPLTEDEEIKFCNGIVNGDYVPSGIYRYKAKEAIYKAAEQFLTVAKNFHFECIPFAMTHSNKYLTQFPLNGIFD